MLSAPNSSADTALYFDGVAGAFARPINAGETKDITLGLEIYEPLYAGYYDGGYAFLVSMSETTMQEIRTLMDSMTSANAAIVSAVIEATIQAAIQENTVAKIKYSFTVYNPK